MKTCQSNWAPTSPAALASCRSCLKCCAPINRCRSSPPEQSGGRDRLREENAAGIPLSAAERNYKDPNHKPELVFALTPFPAMNGFRELADIVSLLQPIAGAHHDIAAFLQQPDTAHLSTLFASLLTMSGEQKSLALGVLKAALNNQQGEPRDTVRFIAGFYPDDSGLFSPLLLNVVQLAPGEAMFLYAETPHAYLKGVALEVMANSDNVLRAGLTPKFIDVPELLANLQFRPQPASGLLTQPEQRGNALFFPIPVEDFAFSLHDLTAAPQALAQRSAAIVFCVAGEATLEKSGQRLTLAGRILLYRGFRIPGQRQRQRPHRRVYNQLA